MARSNLNRIELPEPEGSPKRLQLAPKSDKPARKRRHKVALWLGVGFFSLVLLLIGVGAYLLKSVSFHRYVLAKVEQSVQQSTGAHLQVHDFAVHPFSLSLDLNGIVIHGTESDSSAPLLAADHVGVRVKILSLLHARWNLRDIIIDHPVAHIAVNAHGENNFPTPSQKSNSSTNIFDLAIQHFLIDRGEIYYNDQKSQLDANLQDVNLETNFDPIATRYYGTLEYRNGVIQSGEMNPIVHDLSARFDLTVSRFTLSEAVLKTGASQANLQATIENFNSPTLNAKYDVVLNTDDARRLLKNNTLPTGVVRLSGNAQYESQPNRPPLNALSVVGDATSAALQVRIPSFHGVIHGVNVKYKIIGGNAEVQELRAEVLGGTINGKLTVRDLSGARQGNAQAVVRNVSLADARAAMGTTTAKQDGLTGRASADVDATWHGALQDLIARANATLNAAVSSTQTAGGEKSATLDGVIHAQ